MNLNAQYHIHLIPNETLIKNTLDNIPILHFFGLIFSFDYDSDANLS